MEPKETNQSPDELDTLTEELNPGPSAEDLAEKERQTLIADTLLEASLSQNGPTVQAEEPSHGDQPLLGRLMHTSKEGKKSRADNSQELYLNIRSLVTMMAVFILIFTFVARVIVVSGPSMENTLQNGNVIVIWSLLYEPKQGDIVVLTQQSYQEDSIVKRIIATGGQQVDIDYERGTVSVDGAVLDEPYIKEAMRVPDYGASVTSVTVPEGCLFVMGDNRNHSADSRYKPIGIIDSRCVIGKAVVVLYPFPDFHFL